MRRPLRNVLVFVAVLVMARMFVGVLYEYRYYFPPDFDHSPFLSGRRFSFDSAYRWAFYTHLASGPTTMVLAVVGIGTARSRSAWLKHRVHRWIGRAQMAIVFAMMLPSGLAMAWRAYGGPIAQAGFVALTLATACTAAIGWYQARLGRRESHRRWMTLCTVLLLSPLILRIVAGVLMTIGIESEITYRANAWASWLIPVLVWEGYQQRRRLGFWPRAWFHSPGPAARFHSPSARLSPESSTQEI